MDLTCFSHIFCVSLCVSFSRFLCLCSGTAHAILFSSEFTYAQIFPKKTLHIRSLFYWQKWPISCSVKHHNFHDDESWGRQQFEWNTPFEYKTIARGLNWVELMLCTHYELIFFIGFNNWTDFSVLMGKNLNFIKSRTFGGISLHVRNNPECVTAVSQFCGIQNFIHQ